MNVHNDMYISATRSETNLGVLVRASLLLLAQVFAGSVGRLRAEQFVDLTVHLRVRLATPPTRVLALKLHHIKSTRQRRMSPKYMYVRLEYLVVDEGKRNVEEGFEDLRSCVTLLAQDRADEDSSEQTVHERVFHLCKNDHTSKYFTQPHCTSTCPTHLVAVRLHFGNNFRVELRFRLGALGDLELVEDGGLRALHLLRLHAVE